MSEPWTPGPWKWTDYEAQPQAQQALTGTEAVLFHQALWKVGAADARLIAAAPEMAALLEAAMPYIPDVDLHTDAGELLARVRGEA